MSQSPSPSKKMLDSLNEIDLVAFYTSSYLNNPAPSFQPGPHLSMLFDCLFEGDLSQSRYSESNIFAAKKNGPYHQQRKRESHRGDSHKETFYQGSRSQTYSDAIKGNKASTTDIRRRRETGEEKFIVPVEGVVDVSNEQSESDTVSVDIPLTSEQRKKEEKGKKKSKPKSRKPSVKRVGATTKGKGKELEKKKGNERSKQEREVSPDSARPIKDSALKSEKALGTKRKKVDKDETKRDIVTICECRKS
ncbi:hypothetical protein KY285_023482 [Solanum tuberosum]|nr:hypothetical protein KY289_023815 [Solanum tuberosum]KAH0675681.1 hypothetical protein KY285_023482 [Solanum tuberosum]